MRNEIYQTIYIVPLSAEIILADSEFDDKNDDEFPPSCGEDKYEK